jgi:peroxiredoxin
MKYLFSKAVLPIFAIGVVLCIFISSCANKGYEYNTQGGSDSNKVPDFTLEDLEGNRVSLSDFAGKGVFLVFTTTWCSHCVTVIPDLKKVYAENKDKNFKMLAIYIRESKSKVSSFSENHALPYTVLLDIDGKVASLYQVRGVPTFIAVDKLGIAQYNGHAITDGIIAEIAKK